jgi:hypothetical protein
MDPQLQSRIDSLEKQLDVIHQSVEKTRRYIVGMFIATVVTFILPLVLMVFVLPSIINSYSSQYGDLLR